MVKEPRCCPSLASAEDPVAVWRWDDGMSVTDSKWPSDALAKIRGSWRDCSWQLPRCFVTTGTNYRDNCHETEEDGLWCVAFHSSIVPPYNLAKVRKNAKATSNCRGRARYNPSMFRLAKAQRTQRPQPVAGAGARYNPSMFCLVKAQRTQRPHPIAGAVPRAGPKEMTQSLFLKRSNISLGPARGTAPAAVVAFACMLLADWGSPPF